MTKFVVSGNDRESWVRASIAVIAKIGRMDESERTLADKLRARVAIRIINGERVEEAISAVCGHSALFHADPFAFGAQREAVRAAFAEIRRERQDQAIPTLTS